MYGRKRKGWGWGWGGFGIKNAAKTKTVSSNIYAHTPLRRERKELEVGHCVSGLQKKKKKVRK